MLTLLIVLTGLMAGIYFAFSTFVVKALKQLPALQAALAMNKINDVIVNTIFLPVFFLSTLWFAGLIVWTAADWQGKQSLLFIAAATVYIIGMFFVTAFGNVPLNNKLKACEVSDEQLAQYWPVYLTNWTSLNHIRSMSCIFSCALLSIAITCT